MFAALMMVALFGVPDWTALGACFALGVVVFLFVFYLHPDASDLAPHRTKLDQLLERRDTIYDNPRDLKFENRAGKYSEGDYELMKASLENEAALVLNRDRASDRIADSPAAWRARRHTRAER